MPLPSIKLNESSNCGTKCENKEGGKILPYIFRQLSHKTLSIEIKKDPKVQKGMSVTVAHENT